MKRICIISCFDYYVERTKFVEKYYQNRGYEVVHLVASYDHYRKKDRVKERENVILISCPAYKKNISFARIVSHKQYAENVYKELKIQKPDVIWCVVPPNFLVKYVAKYKKERDCKLIFDVFDLWPESLLSGIKSKLPFYGYWKRLRNNNLKYADMIFTECDYFKKKILQGQKLDNVVTLYLCKEQYNFCDMNGELDELNKEKYNTLGKELHLCYLGNINYLIDIDKIVNLIKKTKEKIDININSTISNKDLIRKVVVHIIGDGERKAEFISALKNAGVEVIYYGLVYDEKEKHKVFDKCHFGLNIMRDTVEVAMTMKSLNYFEAGLPIISNIKYDTEEMIKKYKIGVSVKNNSNDIECLINYSEKDMYMEMVKNVNKLYNDKFSEKGFYQKMCVD